MTRAQRREARRLQPRRRGETAELWFGLVLFVLDVLCQLALIGLGLYIAFGDVLAPDFNDHASVVGLLTLWCLFGSFYWVGAVIAAFASSRRHPVPLGTVMVSRPLQHIRDWLELHPIVGAITTTATFLASFVGLTAAVELLLLRNDPEWGVAVKVVAVWTMLLSWALFHWGYANLYARAYRRAGTVRPLEFPGGEEPGLADFVYFSFTTAATFAASDVSVMTRRMRWTVIWHSTLSFFFNSLIIVLAINTLTGF